MAPLISAIGLYLGQSVVKPFDERATGFCNFTCLIAHPSTGKSPAMNLIKKAVSAVEAFNQIPQHASQLTNIGSVEGLMEYLSIIPCMIGINLN